MWLELLPTEGAVFCTIWIVLWAWEIDDFPCSSVSKESDCSAGDRVRFLGQEDPLEKEMATHSSILAWRIPWTEEPSMLQSLRLQRAGHDWAIKQQQQQSLWGPRPGVLRAAHHLELPCTDRLARQEPACSWVSWQDSHHNSNPSASSLLSSPTATSLPPWEYPDQKSPYFSLSPSPTQFPGKCSKTLSLIKCCPRVLSWTTLGRQIAISFMRAIWQHT